MAEVVATGTHFPAASRSKWRCLWPPVMAFGVLTVAYGYVRNRSGSPGGDELYWVGEALLYGAAGIWAGSLDRGARSEGGAVVGVLATATYVIKEAFAPLLFAFPDESQHYRTLENLLQSHRLFTANPALPTSPMYPGLEIITSYLVNLGHLSVYAAGVVTVGVLHVFTALALYLFAEELSRSARIGAIASVVYATGPHYQFFDSDFVYGAAGIAFLAFALFAAMRAFRMRSSPGRKRWIGLAIACSLATTVSHHVTSYMLLGFLLLLAAGASIQERRLWRGGLAIVGAAVIAVGTWDSLIATATYGYLSPVVYSLFSPATRSTPGKTGPALPAGPPGDRILTYAAVLVTLALASLGMLAVLRRRQRDWQQVFWCCGSATFVLLLLVRLGASDGTELAGRAYTYVLIPTGFAVALVLDPLITTPTRALRTRSRLAIGCGLSALLAGELIALGGLASGWPPWYERLPGPYEAGGWERSVDLHETAFASWAAATLEPDNKVAGDFTTASLVGGIGMQIGVSAQPLLQGSRVDAADKAAIANLDVQLLVLDRRDTEQLPADGYYFSNDKDEGRYTEPLPRSDYVMYDDVSAASRIYDDGTMTAWDVSSFSAKELRFK